ncbi:kelch-like protein 10 [Zootermopsis nevadensis]|uniref:Kelch-like protein 10 n=1 Tax=Zootermopsis nevadensis TaxID=136037 RepID=A0A067R2C7_ZOONE|nr:kelch-like protein 10 [Zootermopsis nevadensis]KDR17179.1 Kelch-like protein 10 [Zootermopsis nevadensis]
MAVKQGSCSSLQDRKCLCTDGLQYLSEFREKEIQCDVVLKLEDGGSFPVHSVILSKFSKYFSELFTEKLRAHEQNDFLVEGVSSDMMAQIQDYMYTKKMDVNHGNVGQLLETSDYLYVEDIIELCCQFHKDRMDLDNCFGILRLAR